MKNKELQTLVDQLIDPEEMKALREAKEAIKNDGCLYMSPLCEQTIEQAEQSPEEFAKEIQGYLEKLQAGPKPEYKFVKVKEHLLLDKLQTEYFLGYIPEKTVHVTQDREVVLMLKRLNTENNDGKRNQILHD